MLVHLTNNYKEMNWIKCEDLFVYNFEMLLYLSLYKKKSSLLCFHMKAVSRIC